MDQVSGHQKVLGPVLRPHSLYLKGGSWESVSSVAWGRVQQPTAYGAIWSNMGMGLWHLGSLAAVTFLCCHRGKHHLRTLSSFCHGEKWWWKPSCRAYLTAHLWSDAVSLAHSLKRLLITCIGECYFHFKTLFIHLQKTVPLTGYKLNLASHLCCLVKLKMVNNYLAYWRDTLASLQVQFYLCLSFAWWAITFYYSVLSGSGSPLPFHACLLSLFSWSSITWNGTPPW